MMLAVAWLIHREIPPGDGQALFSAASEMIRKYESLAKALGDNGALSRFFFLGSGPCYGLACEAMLKMKEMSLSYSEAYHILEFRHGPMSMVGNDSLVIGLLSGNHIDHQLGVLRDVRALGAVILAVAEKDTAEISKVADFVIALDSGLPPVWRAPLYLPVLQLMAYYRAIAKGLDPDHPTHLQAVVRLDE
jgi:glucosamine--fructose-6-phosphate aminotransferase (isomerizing)